MSDNSQKPQNRDQSNTKDTDTGPQGQQYKQGPEGQEKVQKDQQGSGQGRDERSQSQADGAETDVEGKDRSRDKFSGEQE